MKIFEHLTQLDNAVGFYRKRYHRDTHSLRNINDRDVYPY